MSTFKELQDRTLDGSKRAGLTDLTEIKSLVNQAYLEMRARTRPLITDATKTLTVNDDTYSLASDLLLTDVQSIRHIRITDSSTAQQYLLEQVSPDYILMLIQTQSTNGGQMNYYSFDGLDFLRFFPAPSTTTTSATITYVPRPALLVSDGDVPAGIPVEFHDVIVLGALARSLRVWHPQTAMGYHSAWLQGLDEYRKWKNRYGGSWASKGIVKGSRTNTAPHDNSTYYTGWD